MPRSVTSTAFCTAQDRRLHGEPDADPDDGAEPGDDRDRGVETDGGERERADRHDDATQDRPGAVATGPLDPVPRERRGRLRSRS